MNRGQFRRDGHQTRRRPAIDSLAARRPLLLIGSSGVSSFMALHLLSQHCTCRSSTRHAEIELLAVLYCTEFVLFSAHTSTPLAAVRRPQVSRDRPLISDQRSDHIEHERPVGLIWSLSRFPFRSVAPR